MGSLAERPRITKARIAPPHVLPSARAGIQLPALNLKAIGPPVNGQRTTEERRDNARRAFSRRETGREQSFRSSGVRILGKEWEGAPRPKSPPWPWTPPSPFPTAASPGIRRSQSPGRKKQQEVHSNSGATTDRGPAKHKGGELDSQSRGKHVKEFKGRSNRMTTPYVDIVGRHTQLDLTGGIRFPTRGAPREKGKITSEVPMDPNEQYFQVRLQKNAHDTKTLSEYGGWLNEKGRFKEADKHVRTALTEEPFNSQTLNAYAMLLWKQKKHSKAQDMLQNAIKADPHNLPGSCYIRFMLSYLDSVLFARSAMHFTCHVSNTTILQSFWKIRTRTHAFFLTHSCTRIYMHE